MKSNDKAEKTAVLFVNLGTPEAPTTEAIFPYLSEFLLDRHVVDLPSFFWKPLLTKLILPLRMKQTVANYSKIWMKEGSPLFIYSQRLVDAIAKRASEEWHCRLAMTYGKPSLSTVLPNLKGYKRIKIIPLFPQYSTTTTQAVLDKIKTIVASWDSVPQLEYIRDYADESIYIEALSENIAASFQRNGVPDVLLFSYHGIPIRYVKGRNDTYMERCERTTACVTKALKRKGIDIPILHGYQSRFGKGKWSEPNVTPLLGELAKNNQHHVQMICPGFAVDCVETLEEIAKFNKTHFIAQGGKQFHYISALNDSSKHCELMLTLINKARSPLKNTASASILST